MHASSYEDKHIRELIVYMYNIRMLEIAPSAYLAKLQWIKFREFNADMLQNAECYRQRVE